MEVNYDSLQIVKECLWAFSNITAGSEDHIRMFLSCETLVEKILQMMNSLSNEIKREAILTFTNLIATTQNTQVLIHVSNLHEGQFIQYLVAGLRQADSNLIIEVLQAFNELLKLDKVTQGPVHEKIGYRMEIAGALDEIENLQKHPNH